MPPNSFLTVLGQPLTCVFIAFKTYYPTESFISDLRVLTQLLFNYVATVNGDKEKQNFRLPDFDENFGLNSILEICMLWLDCHFFLWKINGDGNNLSPYREMSVFHYKNSKDHDNPFACFEI